MSNKNKKNSQFCSFHSLIELKKSPTRVKCNAFSLIDHILTYFPDRTSQQGLIDVGLSDH